MNYKIMDLFLKEQDKIIKAIILWSAIILLICSFTVRADTFTDLYDDPFNLLSGTEKIEHTIVKHEFTSNTEKIEYSDNTGNIIISSGQIYADSLGTRLENAKSLKDCEFCNGLKMNINLDKKFNVTIEDYNYTDFKNVCFMSTDIGQIPLKINLLTNKSEKQLDIKIPTTAQTVNKWRCYNFTVPKSILDYEIEWGWNSTTISLTKNSTENMQDTYVVSISATTNYGAEITMRNSKETGATVGQRESFTQWNISIIPPNIVITEAYLNLECYTNGLDSSSEKLNLTLHYYYQSINEYSLTWNNVNFSNYNTTPCGYLLIDGTDYPPSDTRIDINATGCIQEAYNKNGNNVTLLLNTTGAVSAIADEIRWKTKEFIGKEPILNISYIVLEDSTPPSFSTIPYNSTTTNESAVITWIPSESANYTLRYTTWSNYTGGTLISNSTSSVSQRDVGISPLVNYTQYYINVSIWDTSGNYNQSNFSFRTNQNTVASNSCSTCNILCSDNCVLTTNINCAAGAATVSGAGTLTGQRYLTNWQTMYISGGCVTQY